LGSQSASGQNKLLRIRSPFLHSLFSQQIVLACSNDDYLTLLELDYNISRQDLQKEDTTPWLKFPQKKLVYSMEVLLFLFLLLKNNK